MAKCSLCGGTLDANRRCSLCGLDNTKNDEQYKHMLNRNDCDDQPLTHVHEHVQKKKANVKFPKKDVNKKNATSIIGVIVALISVFSAIFGFLEEAFFEEVHVEAAYETYLEPGTYAIGTHIPEGTYTLEIDTGEWGLVEILEDIDGEIF